MQLKSTVCISVKNIIIIYISVNKFGFKFSYLKENKFFSDLPLISECFGCNLNLVSSET